MDRRRRVGIALIVAGILVAVLGRAAASGLWGDVVTLSLSIVGLIAGGVLIALSYRDELPRSLSVSRSSLLASQAVPYTRTTSAADAIEQAHFERYVETFNDALDRCELLLESRATFEQLEAAREQLMGLVANVRYGTAIARGRVDTERVARLTRRLASAL